MKDSLGSEFHYTYDLNGNQTAVIYPDGSKESVEYDARGRITGKNDRNGNKTTYG